MPSFDSRALLATLPDKPGVYQMINARGAVIYVGKARLLKRRVAQYFNGSQAHPKTARMVSLVVDVRITLTDTESDALLLEANLIKSHRPRYNVLLRDDKSYPYLTISTHQSFPRIDYCRGKKPSQGKVFGPYPDVGSVRALMSTLHACFQLRQCTDSVFKHRSRPCLQHQIKRCSAPCVGKISQSDYRFMVDQALHLLSGKNETVANALTQKMQAASTAFAFEEAAALRDQIAQLRKIQTPAAMMGSAKDTDILGYALSGQLLCVSIVFFRGGKVIGEAPFFCKMPEGTPIEEALSLFMGQYYLGDQQAAQSPRRIVLPMSVSDKPALQLALKLHLSHSVTLLVGVTPEQKGWLRMAFENAAHHLSLRDKQSDQVRMRLEALSNVLKLKQRLSRIECFDISHTGGVGTVASCVVYGKEGAEKSAYRQYTIKDITPGDDYAAMAQVVQRRLLRAIKERAPLPDLLLIDGGLGQYNRIKAVLSECQLQDLPMIAVSKGASRKPGLEKLITGDGSDQIHLKPQDPALLLIQFIRDESHRFAIRAHKKQRAKLSKSSLLSGIPGIGEKRRQALLTYFGGLQGLKGASVDAIAKVPGISVGLAKSIREKLHAA